MEQFTDWVGRSERRTDRVTAGAVARFHATTGSAELPDAMQAPAGFHWCLCLPDAPIAELGHDGHPRKGGFLPPVPLARRMWAASELEFIAPIRIGAEVERLSTVRSVREKTGRSGAMVFVEVDHLICADGSEAVRERQMLVYRDAPSRPLALPAERAVDTGGWTFSRRLRPDATLLFRYSALTFNSHRIHYDLPYAQREEGYPALVVQGPLTATMLLDLAHAHCAGASISHFAFRAVAPAFAGQALYLVGRRPARTQTLELAALGADGRMVMDAQATLR